MMRLLSAALLALWLSGCGGAFAAAMDRGDLAASEGRWDIAADAYERATRLDPDDEEARSKLENARREQARARVAKAQALLDAGKAEEAMQPFFDAMRLDKRSLEAQRGYEAARTEVLARAERAGAAGDHKEAYRLARHVLLFEPAGTLNTGDVRNERTVERPERI